MVRRRVRMVALSTLVLVAAVPATAAAGRRPGAVDPNASPRVARALAERYAPLLYLGSTEAWGPMRVPDFLVHSDLMWVRAGRDLLLARDGAVRAARLGAPLRPGAARLLSPREDSRERRLAAVEPRRLRLRARP
jgi:hypothetical protein